jgi:hypothetical protein
MLHGFSGLEAAKPVSPALELEWTGRLQSYRRRVTRAYATWHGTAHTWRTQRDTYAAMSRRVLDRAARRSRPTMRAHRLAAGVWRRRFVREAEMTAWATDGRGGHRRARRRRAHRARVQPERRHAGHGRQVQRPKGVLSCRRIGGAACGRARRALLTMAAHTARHRWCVVVWISACCDLSFLSSRLCSGLVRCCAAGDDRSRGGAKKVAPPNESAGQPRRLALTRLRRTKNRMAGTYQSG